MRNDRKHVMDRYWNITAVSGGAIAGVIIMHPWYAAVVIGGLAGRGVLALVRRRREES